jgi:hypothetical protein
LFALGYLCDAYCALAIGCVRLRIQVIPSATAAAATSRMAMSAVSTVTAVAAHRSKRCRGATDRAVRGNARGTAGGRSTGINFLPSLGVRTQRPGVQQGSGVACSGDLQTAAACLPDALKPLRVEGSARKRINDWHDDTSASGHRDKVSSRSTHQFAAIPAGASNWTQWRAGASQGWNIRARAW